MTFYGRVVVCDILLKPQKYTCLLKGIKMSKFNLLAYILPPEEKVFYSLFEESAQVCFDVASLYKDIVTSSLTDEHVINVKRLKHKSNDLLKETLHQLNVTLITPIDREDIQSIASLLNKITKRIVKASLNLKVYRLENFTENMQKQAQTLYQATEELKIIIHNFKKSSSIKEMTETNLKMKEIESYGDEIHYHAIDELFSGKYDALTVIKLRDIHKDIENALDSCFSVSDAVVNVVLKQS